jgi:uncharacterized protein (TIGR03435 family)
VFKISKADAGGLKAVMYSIDQGAQGIPAAAVTLQGSVVKIAIPALGGTYEGKLANTDATSITGMWSQGPGPPQGPPPMALDLTVATDKTAWAIPEPPPPPTPMAADAAPAFEVATIKPSKPEAQGRGIGLRGRNFSTLNTSLSYLITFAYGLHPRQIAGGPGWLDTDNYDLAGVPDKPGMPNDKQVKMMVQKLLADRFKLIFHREKKELTVFAITIGKGGPTLTKSTADTNGVPGLGFRGLGNLVARNATMDDFASLMQTSVLDRPVVDQTGLTGRFDFTLNWTPDETQFTAMGVKVPPPPENAEHPDLFTAVQQQLGLKMESTKAQVDVLVIDHVEKPSDN